MNSERGNGSVNNRVGESGGLDRSTTTCLDVDDLAEVIAALGLDRFVDELIEAIGDAARTYDPTEVEHLTRDGFSYTTPRVGLVEWMPAMTVGDVAAIKTVAYHPDNPTALGLPSVLATTSVYDTTDGRLLSICEATVLTALRTGAASAVMTDALVRPGPITLGVVGCGAQAVTQIHAISRVRPIERLIVTDRDPAIAATLGSRLPSGTLASAAIPEVYHLESFEHRVPDLDVLCTCTSVEIDHGPVLELRQAKPSLHINAVGSDFPGKIELPVDYLRASVIVPDAIDQCLAEGESQQLTADDLGPDMVAVLTDPANQELVSQRTVFDSTGWSYEDLVAAQLFAKHAEKLGLGTDLRLQHQPTDPYDPLEAIRSRDGQ